MNTNNGKSEKNYKKIGTTFGSGIDEEFVENSGDFQELVKSFVCCICLDIVKQPMQCQKCESLYCGECWEILKIGGKNCVYNCPASCITGASKFVLELLKNLSLRCELCGRKGIDYHTFVKHIEGCSLNLKFSNRDDINVEIKERDKKIEQLKSEINILRHSQKEKLKEQEQLKKDQSQVNTVVDPAKAKLRQELITHSLNTNQKMELYKATIEGRILDFKQMVLQKKYPILEEVSAANYYWTSLHYAMHYGQMEIALFCFEVLKNQNILEKAMKLESNDGRCPILCLLRSNSLNLEKKKEFLELLLKTFRFKVSDNAKTEMKKRQLDNLITTYNC